MSDPSNQPARSDPLTPDMIEFATKMYDSARIGDVAVFQQALPAGLPPNLTNDKGDTLVGQPSSYSLRSTDNIQD